MTISPRRLIAAAILVSLGAAGPVAAQDTPPLRLFPQRFAGDIRHLATRTPLIIIAAGGALAAAAAPADQRTTRIMSGDRAVEESLDAGSAAGSGYVQVGAAAALYAGGALAHAPRVAILGTELLEAQALSGLLTQAVKISVQRQRPDGGRNSFPSGHASATFATAGIIAQTYGWRSGVLAYAGAAYVGASRISDRHHYTSDVIFGAALGLASSHAVHRSQPHEREARLTLMAAPGRRDISVVGAYRLGR
jgi:membrane-associated phospholipid phosphatase